MIAGALIFFFMFGTIIGSFINVLVFRYGTGRGARGRSFCLSCGKPLSFVDLVPVWSFIMLGGRCRHCKSRISWQYPLVELITGAVFVLVFWKNLQLITYNLQLVGLLVVGGELFVWSLLIAFSVYDLRHKIIPDAFVYTAVLVSFVLLFLRADFTALDAWGAVFLAAPFAALWLFSHGRLMGLGDAKLLLLFSPFLGFAKGLSALLVGFWIGALVSIAGLVCKGLLSSMPEPFCSSLKSRLKNLTMKSELPLAPFLVVGLFIVYLTGVDVTGLSLLPQ